MHSPLDLAVSNAKRQRYTVWMEWIRRSGIRESLPSLGHAVSIVGQVPEDPTPAVFGHIIPFGDPGSPKLRMVSWNLNTIRFVSVIGHPLLIIWEYDELIPSVFHLHCWSNFIRCLHNWFLNIVYLRDQITFWEWFHGTYIYYAFRRWLNIPIIIWEYDEPIHACRAWFLAQRLNSGDVSPYVSNSSLREYISIGELESQGGFPYMNKNVIIHPWYIFIYYIR